ncbi:MAG TPA: class I SAM-dependent methyltransferase [Chthoniobacterales bacterium]
MNRLTLLKRMLLPSKQRSDAMRVDFVVKRPGWMTENIREPAFAPPLCPEWRQIEKQAAKTEALGAKPLWDGYKTVVNYPRATSDSQRSSDQVRSTARAGIFFAWLASRRSANLIVEFGTAFGVSGMYWLAGLKQNQSGRLLTFEPNPVWAEIARHNLAQISNQFELTVGTFEEHIDAKLGPFRRIDIAFVDAIHTGDFVRQQFDLLAPRMQAGGLILVDDVNFSPDMATCWQSLARDPRAHASITLDGRIGLVELAGHRRERAGA